MAQRRDDVRPDDAVERVLAGERHIEVARDGDVVALVIGPESTAGPTVRRAKVVGGFSSLPRATIDEPTQELLDDLRSER